MKTCQDAVLILSKDNTLKEIVKGCVLCYPNIAILTKFERETTTEYEIQIVFFDNINDLENIHRIFFKDLIFISRNNSIDEYKRVLLNNNVHIVEKPINENLMKAIVEKSFGLLKDSIARYIEYHGLRLYYESHYVLFKNCKISLSKKECCVFKKILDHQNGGKDAPKVNESCNKKYLEVIVFRINRKFLTATNTKVIRCKYGSGYYITV